MIGAAVVGLGVGAAHARAYLRDERSELRWVHDLDAERARAVAAELGVRAASSYEQILADEEVSVISIASFDDAHYEQALAALERGMHLFVEKPLCRTLEELRSLKRTWQRSGRPVLASNLVLRAAPLFAWLRDELRRGSLGTVYAFDGDYLYGRLHKITDGWRRDVDDYSVMLGGGVHLVDLMLWLTHERPVRVAAAGNRIATAGTAFRYDDFASATFEFPSDLVGRITANFGAVHRHQHVVRVFGTAATFIHDDAGSRLHESYEPESRPRLVELAPAPETKGALVPLVLDAIASGEGSAAAEHEFAVINACIAADRALAEKEVVDIDYD